MAGIRNNSGSTGGGWTITAVAAGKGKVRAIRNETKKPDGRKK
jgi:hypothetical protein